MSVKLSAWSVRAEIARRNQRLRSFQTMIAARVQQRASGFSRGLPAHTLGMKRPHSRSKHPSEGMLSAVGCGLWAVGCGLSAVGCRLWAVARYMTFYGAVCTVMA